MPKTYSKDFIDAVNADMSDSAGVYLAKVCVEAKLPAAFVAKTLGVSRMTLYSWFRGGEIRWRNSLLAEALADQISKDLKAGVLLPAKNMQEARRYLENLGKTFHEE